MSGITLNRAGMTAQKTRLRAQLDRAMQDNRAAFAAELRTVAGETAVALGERTFPSALAIGYAVRSVRADVACVYALPGRVYETLEAANPAQARAFWAAMKRGDLSRARQIVRESGTSLAGIEIGAPLRPSHHTSSRDPKTGNVVIPQPLQMVTKQERDDYTRKIVRELGKTASGWMAAANELGANGNLVRWKSPAIHGSDGGSAQMSISGKSLTITLENHRHLARKHISPGQVARILDHAHRTLILRTAPKAAAA